MIVYKELYSVEYLWSFMKFYLKLYVKTIGRSQRSDRPE